MKKAPPFPRRLGCHCSEYFMDCTYHYGLKTCITCGHACCDNHSYWMEVDKEGRCPVVRCVCCIHKEREEAKKEKAEKEKATSSRESERPRSRSRGPRSGAASSRDS